MATNRFEQRLLSEVPQGGVFGLCGWLDDRKLYEVKKHYDGFTWIYDEDGKRKKGSLIIPRTQAIPIGGGNPVAIDNENVYVMMRSKV